MDTYYRKTRRITASSSLKKPPPQTITAETPKLTADPLPKTPAKATITAANATPIIRTQPPTIDGDDGTTTSRSNKIITAKSNSTPTTETSTGSPAKTPSPPPRPRPTTPTHARLARPTKPPPVKRKLLADDPRRARRPAAITPRELFRSIHPLEPDEVGQQQEEPSSVTLNEDRNNNDNNQQGSSISQSTTTKSTVITSEIAASFGLKRLNLPATPPATPVKQQVKRLPEPQSPSKKLCPESPSKIAAGPLKGVSSSLLDLIRAKEAKAKETTPEQLRQRHLLSIAPEIARIVPTVFISNKKDFILYDRIIEKCYKGLKSDYTTDTIVECLDLMNKIAPEWIAVVSISKGKFMRYNKDKYSLSQLMMAIDRYKREKGFVK